MAPPRQFGMACETEDAGAGLTGVSPTHADAGPGYSWTLLQRHGRRPLAVLGRSLIQASNRCTGLPCWSEIFIYETSARRFAAALRHAEAAGPAWCDAWVCDSAAAVRSVFYQHDPLAAFSWHPLPERDLAPGWGATGFADFEMSRQAADAQRFGGAWAGLLAAMFGLPAMQRTAE